MLSDAFPVVLTFTVPDRLLLPDRFTPPAPALTLVVPLMLLVAFGDCVTPPPAFTLALPPTVTLPDRVVLPLVLVDRLPPVVTLPSVVLPLVLSDAFPVVLTFTVPDRLLLPDRFTPPAPAVRLVQPVTASAEVGACSIAWPAVPVRLPPTVCSPTNVILPPDDSIVSPVEVRLPATRSPDALTFTVRPPSDTNVS